MFSSVLSAAIVGMEVRTIAVEADISNGLPVFHMVGFATSQVKEAQERVRTALRNTGIELPPRRMIVNLAPADIRKEGSGYDLPVAVAILAAMGKIPARELKEYYHNGEKYAGWVCFRCRRCAARGDPWKGNRDKALYGAMGKPKGSRTGTGDGVHMCKGSAGGAGVFSRE